MVRSITAYDFYDSLGVSNMAELLNMLKNTASPMYQRNVPDATLDNINLVGAGILQYPATQNDFIKLFIEHIALTVLKDSQLDNDFKPFKNGTITMGRHVQEIFIDRLESTPFDLYKGEDEAFTIKKPDIKVIYHTRNRQDKFEVSISEDDLQTAFRSYGELESFVTGVLNQLISSNEADEYEYTLALFDNYQDKKLFTQVSVPNYKETGIDRSERKARLEDLVEVVRSTVTRLTLGVGSRGFNALSVQRRSQIEDLYFFLTPELDSAIDVNVLASAFNMDKQSFLAHKFVVTDFSDPNFLGALVDRKWFQLYDNKKVMRVMQNGANLTDKYFYHVWNTFSVSQLENAVAFVINSETGVYRIGFQAMEVDVRGGGSYQAIPIVRAYDGTTVDESKIKYTLTGQAKAGTKVDANGVVTVAIDETAPMVKLEVSYDNGTEETPDVIKGYMTVYPVKTLV